MTAEKTEGPAGKYGWSVHSDRTLCGSVADDLNERLLAFECDIGEFAGRRRVLEGQCHFWEAQLAAEQLNGVARQRLLRALGRAKQQLSPGSPRRMAHSPSAVSGLGGSVGERIGG